MPETRPSGDPLVFRPPIRRRRLQIAIGVPLTLLILAPTVFAAWLVWSPRAIELAIDEGRLEINTGPEPFSGRRTVDLGTVVSVTEVQLGRGRRTAGTELPGYCVGRFTYAELGSVWQATDCSRTALMLRFDRDRPVVLTPPEPDRFRRAITAGTGYHETLPPPETGPGWLAVKVLVLLAPLLGLVVPIVFMVAPTRIRYRNEPGALVVTTVLGSRRFATVECHAHSHRPKVGVKLWGTGAPGYYTGLYRVDGANARIYTTSVDEGVLIEGESVRVFVNPEDEAGFLEALRTLGGARSE